MVKRVEFGSVTGQNKIMLFWCYDSLYWRSFIKTSRYYRTSTFNVIRSTHTSDKQILRYHLVSLGTTHTYYWYFNKGGSWLEKLYDLFIRIRVQRCWKVRRLIYHVSNYKYTSTKHISTLLWFLRGMKTVLPFFKMSLGNLCICNTSLCIITYH